MKKLTSILLIIAILTSTLALASCESVAILSGLGKVLDFLKPLVDDHTHVWGPLEAVDSTCTEHGLSEGKWCHTCGEVLIAQVQTPLAPHELVTIPGYAATCHTPGLTDGVKCTRCLVTVIEGHEIPALAHNYEAISAVESTCMTQGLTEGKQCTLCDDILVYQQDAPLKCHTYAGESDTDCNVCNHSRIPCNHSNTAVISSQAASCTRIGLTEGKICLDCNEIIVAQTATPIKPHTEVTLSSTLATCARAGLTEGRMCTACGQITKSQSLIPATPHVFASSVDEVIDPSGSITKAHFSCTVCGAVSLDGSAICLKSDLVIRPTGGIAEALDFVSNGDGSCYVSGIGSCKSANIVIPSTSPSGDRVTAIGERAFYGRGELESVTIPTSVTSIGANAFYGCKIKSVNYTGGKDAWDAVIIYYGNTALGTIARLYAEDYGPQMSVNNIDGSEVVGGNGYVVKNSVTDVRLTTGYSYNMSAPACLSSGYGITSYYSGAKIVDDPTSSDNKALMITATNHSSLQFSQIKTDELVASGFGGADSSVFTLEVTLGSVNGVAPSGIQSYIRHRLKPENSDVDASYFCDLRIFKIDGGELLLADGTSVGKIPESGMRRFTITIDTQSGRICGYAGGASGMVETTADALIAASYNFKSRQDAYLADPESNSDLACYKNLYTFFTEAGKLEHSFYKSASVDSAEFESAAIELDGVMTKVKNDDGSFNLTAVQALAERECSLLLGYLRFGFKTVNCSNTDK